MVSLHPVVWWEGLKRYKPLSYKFVDFAVNLQKVCAKRIFFNLTLFQSKLRNKLGLEKCSKLVPVYRMLNLKTKLESCADEYEDDLDDDIVIA